MFPLVILWLGVICTILNGVHSAPRIASDPVVALDYGRFRGSHSTAYNITIFRRIPFAAPPTGLNRFNAPQPPLKVEGVYDSNRAFDRCPSGQNDGSEDCLYLGLYSRPWNAGKDPAMTSRKRPVVIFFHGGGFIRGGGSLGLPPSAYPVLNVSRDNDFIMVYPNYRLNAFGLLGGSKIKQSPNSALNPGLLDQDAVLQWTRKHIAKFGGDPEDVAIWGQSAGAGSVVAQVLAQSERPEKLFRKAAASSPFWPRTYAFDSPEVEAQYGRLVNLAGCGASEDSLKCLKDVDYRKIQQAAAQMTDDFKYTTSSFNWAPVIDGQFLKEPLTTAAASGKLNTELVFGMYNSHEGENFVSGDLKRSVGATFNSSEAGFDKWLEGFLPHFRSAQLSKVKDLYPNKGRTETYQYNSTFDRAGLIYRDAVLSCPQYWISKGATKGGWIGEYTIQPAKHASDVGLWNTINQSQKDKEKIYRGFAGAWAAFFQNGDPNVSEPTQTVGPPKVSSGSQWVIKDHGFEAVPLAMLESRCAFWLGNGKSVPL